MISKLLCTDVLAIRCIGDFVFVAIGCTLHIFSKNDSYKLVKTIRCLYPKNIHGIVDSFDNKLAVFGANSICVYNLNVEDEIPTLSELWTKQFNDWIIAAQWSMVDNHVYLSILFAHNSMSLYDLINKSHRTIHCEERCILYGGSIFTQGNGDLVVFSGTVFQEILIWQVKHDCSDVKNAKVLHRLTGHKGVIFSVIYDPLKQLICSTSDDRTVRLWKVTNKTEFDVSDWTNIEIRLMKTMFGHSARVWRSIIKDDTIITIGEDSLICTWSLDGKLLDKVDAHHGAAIWSIDISDDNKTVFTGGADGSVQVHPTISSYLQKSILLPENCEGSVLKHVCYLSSGTLLILQENGTLICHGKDDDRRTETLYLERYSSYCIMQVSPCRTYVSFASRDGYVAIYKEKNGMHDKKMQQILEEKIMDSQILSLHWISNDTLIACGTSGYMKTFRFTPEGSVCVQFVCSLPPSRERWLTAATVFEKLLICGDRAGNLHVYELEDSTPHRRMSINDAVSNPAQTISKIHGRIGVQTFTVLDTKLLSAGRDGVLRFYELRKDDGWKVLYALHKLKMPMDWISGTLKVDDNVLVFGFKEVEFVIYSMFHDRVLARIPCGGGHRSWDYTLTGESFTLAYIRNKNVFIFKCALNSIRSPLLLNGFHAKEVYLVQPLQNFADQNIFASGGEDGTLRVSCVTKSQQGDNYNYRTLGTFDGHISCIKCVATVNLKNEPTCSTHLLFSGGGRAQLKVWEVIIKYDAAKLQYADFSCSELASHMLYGLDRHRKKPWQENKQSYIVEPETRYMDISVYRCPQNTSRMLLFIGCGDGCTRLFLYNRDKNVINLRRCVRYVDRCILKIHVLKHKERVMIITMTTDGVVRFFDFTDTVLKILKDEEDDNDEVQSQTDTPLAEFNFHQSGINSFDIKSVGDDVYLLATGGDDNLLNLVSFKICTSSENEPSISLLSKWCTARAHSAQITGVMFQGEDKLYSVGIDQEIITHAYKYSEDSMSANILNRIFTSVADVQGLTMWPSIKNGDAMTCVYGRGIEVLFC